MDESNKKALGNGIAAIRGSHVMCIVGVFLLLVAVADFFIFADSYRVPFPPESGWPNGVLPLQYRWPEIKWVMSWAVPFLLGLAFLYVWLRCRRATLRHR